MKHLDQQLCKFPPTIRIKSFICNPVLVEAFSASVYLKCGLRQDSLPTFRLLLDGQIIVLHKQANASGDLGIRVTTMVNHRVG